MATVDTSVYVHFPWCVKRCPYCDFTTVAAEPADVPHEAYADAVLRELADRAGLLDDRRLVSVFFGGGTPSLWQTPSLGRALEGILAAFPDKAPDVEITVECNPSTLDEDKARALVAAGVNRFSVGVQSLDDETLRFLGRRHDREGALRSIAGAQATGMRTSGDLMFGMPADTTERVVASIDHFVGLGLSHVSLYSLTIESGTPFGELYKKGKLRLAIEDSVAEIFEAAHARFAEHGFEHYEVSNYARPGQASRHNQHYWRGGAYLGLGAAAVGCLDAGTGTGRRYRNEPDGMRYLDVTATDRESSSETLDAQTIVREALMLGLRTREGVDLAAVEARAGVAVVTGREREIAARVARGDLTVEGGHMRVPISRWLHLDGIIADLF